MASALEAVFAARGGNGCGRVAQARGLEYVEEDALRIAYMLLSLLPTLAVVTLAWIVWRAVSVRIVWRETDARRLDDRAA